MTTQEDVGCCKCHEVVPIKYLNGEAKDEMWVECSCGAHDGWYCPDCSPGNDCWDDEECDCCNPGWDLNSLLFEIRNHEFEEDEWDDGECYKCDKTFKKDLDGWGSTNLKGYGGINFCHDCWDGETGCEVENSVEGKDGDMYWTPGI